MNFQSQLISGDSTYCVKSIRNYLMYLEGQLSPIVVCPLKKTSGFVDFHWKPVMQNGWSYIRDSNDFIDKIKNLKNLPSNSILVTADIVGFYPSIHQYSPWIWFKSYWGSTWKQQKNLSLLAIDLKSCNLSKE